MRPSCASVNREHDLGGGWPVQRVILYGSSGQRACRFEGIKCPNYDCRFQIEWWPSHPLAPAELTRPQSMWVNQRPSSLETSSSCCELRTRRSMWVWGACLPDTSAWTQGFSPNDTPAPLVTLSVVGWGGVLTPWALRLRAERQREPAAPCQGCLQQFEENTQTSLIWKRCVKTPEKNPLLSMPKAYVYPPLLT